MSSLWLLGPHHCPRRLVSRCLWHALESRPVSVILWLLLAFSPLLPWHSCLRSTVNIKFPYSALTSVICPIGTTYPLDLVRSRLSIATASIPTIQVSAASSSTAAAQPALASAYHTASTAARSTAQSLFSAKDLTMWGMTLKVMREEGGVRALYRGLVATAMGVAPYVGK